MRTEARPAPAPTAPDEAAQRSVLRRRRRRLRWRRRVTVVVLASFVVGLPSGGADLPPPIFVRVRDVVRLMSPGTRLETVARVEGLRARVGDFLDVEGAVLEARRYPGHLTVNGEAAEPDRVLADGDVLGVVHGKDRTEKLRRSIVDVPGGRVANPQASLATAPGEQVITRGAVSGKLVSTVFRPTGPYEAPLQVALTFDDGPSSTYTPQILDILARNDVRATFFVVGTMAERNPGLIRRMIREGHTVANHTYAHPIGGSFADRPKNEIREEMDHMQRVLRGFGIEPVGFRPPGGSWSDFVVDEAERRGMRTILWAVDSKDWLGPGWKELQARVVSETRPGAIILLHDGGGDRSATVRALPGIIRELRERGLEPVPIT